MATYPSLVMVQQLAEVVKARLGTAFAIGQDASGDPTIVFGPGTAGTVSAFVRIKPRDVSPVFDIVGHVQPQYGKPHKAEIVIEGISGAGANPAGYALPNALVAELARVGVKVELYVVANGVAPTAAGAIAANLKSVWEDLFNPIASTM
jgi:hypothetical protein